LFKVFGEFRMCSHVALIQTQKLPVSNGRVHDFTPDGRFFVSGYPRLVARSEGVFPVESGEAQLSAVGDDTFRLSHILI
jgi:hypothetical protein